MRSLIAIYITLSMSFGLCQTDRNLKSIIPKDSFPEGMFFPSQMENDSLKIGLHGLKNSWYSSLLDTLSEPNIYENDTLNSYRLLYLRSFANPISIRLEVYQKRASLTIRVCSGNGSYFSRPLKKDTTITIFMSEYLKFKKLIRKANYWNLNTTSGNSGKDGSMWILEVSTPRHYHVVDRWSAKNTDRAFYKCCKYLIELSELKISTVAKLKH